VKIFLLGLFAVANLLVQQTLFDKISILGVKPDLLLVLIIFTALLEGPVTGLKLGLAIGLLQDLATGKFIGLYLLSGGITGYLVGLVETRIFKENYLVPMVVLLGGTVFHQGLYLFLRSLIGYPAGWIDAWLGVILPLALYHALIGPFLYVPAYKVYVRWWRQIG